MENKEQFKCISPNTGEAFDTWTQTSVSEFSSALERLNDKSFIELSKASNRASALILLSNAIEKAREEFEGLIVAEVGKTQSEAKAEIDYAKSFLIYMSDLLSSANFKEEIEDGRWINTVPLGLGLLITPYNDPLAGITRKIANCIGSGAGAIIKPPELGIKTASKLEEVIGLEKLDHLMCFLKTKDREIIKQLMHSREIGVISFTGSTEVGKILSINAGSGLKRFVGELGGINPFIIFSDADIEKAVTDLVIRKIKAAGQACSAQNILFLEKDIANDVIEKIESKFVEIESLPTDKYASALMGPIRTKKALEDLYSFEERLNQSGARCIINKNQKHVGDGFFYNPAAYLCEEPDLFMEHEIFAPLLGICVFDDRKSLKKLLHNNQQPLVLYAYSQDHTFLNQFITSLNYGSIGLNNTGIQGAQAPTGGFKEAGLGREGGAWGLSEFTTTINVKEVFS